MATTQPHHRTYKRVNRCDETPRWEELISFMAVYFDDRIHYGLIKAARANGEKWVQSRPSLLVLERKRPIVTLHVDMHKLSVILSQDPYHYG